MAKLAPDGSEILDPTPVAIPVRFSRPPSVVDDVRRMVAAELSRLAQDQGFESFDEAEDFEPDDAPEFTSRYEEPEHYEPWQGFRERMTKPPVVEEKPKPPAEPTPPEE